MGDSPNPVNRRNLTRASIIGILLSASGIVLFVVLWLVLGNWGLSQVPRLLISVCAPPGLIAALVGIYFLFVQPRNSS